MPLQAENDLDLVTTTLRELGEYKWTDILSSILKKEKVGFHAGTQIQFNVQVNPSGAFSMVGMAAQDKVNILDLMTTGVLPFRHGNTNYGFEGRELAMNRK